MKRGISEKFDEHEQDTARRQYSKEMVDSAKRTAKMEKFDLDQVLRTESGTRPAITSDQIDLEHQMRAQMESNLHAHEAFDPHARPTIETSTITNAAAVNAATHEAATRATPAFNPEQYIARETPVIASGIIATGGRIQLDPTQGVVADGPTQQQSSSVVTIPKWAFALGVAIVLMLIASAGAVGFILGRAPRPVPPTTH